MRGGVDEVREADESCAEAYGGPVEGCHEDLGVRVEGLRRVDVVGDEGAEPLLVGVDAFLAFARDGDVGTAGIDVLVDCFFVDLMLSGIGGTHALKNLPFPVSTVTKTSSIVAT